MATIRGTPQYLSPALWQAHVEEGSQRHAQHNIFKSDVFSCGLIMFQFASMEDVTGFNQKNAQTDGELLIEEGLRSLRTRYSEHILEIIKLMLKFEESQRPSFTELSKLVLTSTENTIESQKDNNVKVRQDKQSSLSQIEHKRVPKVHSMKELKENPI